MSEEFHTVIPRSFEACKETILYDLHFTLPPTRFTFTNQLSVKRAVWGRSYFISDEEFRVEMQGVDLVIEGFLVPLQEDSTEVTGYVESGGQCIRFNILVPFGWTAIMAVFFYIGNVSLLFLIVLAPAFLAVPFALCHVMTEWHSRWTIRGFIESLKAES